MKWLVVICILAVSSGCSGSGVTKDTGISQFWTDDYKVFEQVYGKTSDKELYGASLPPTISYGSQDLGKYRQQEASEKNERYIENDEETPVDPYAEDAYSRFLSKQALKESAKKIQALKAFEKPYIDFSKPIKGTQPTYKFIGYNGFKPISKNNDPETYAYLKHLDQLEDEKTIDFPDSFNGFKPYISTASSNIRDSDAYKSIQDILDAHESKKNKKRQETDDDDVKYLNYGGSKKRGPKSKTRSGQNNYVSNSRCWSGRCRKRSTNHGRSRSRPIVRTVKHRIVTTH